MAHRGQLSQAIGDEIIRVIQEQQDLEKDFKLLIQERMGLKNTGNKMKVKDNQERLFDVTTKLRKTCFHFRRPTSSRRFNCKPSPAINSNEPRSLMVCSGTANLKMDGSSTTPTRWGASSFGELQK